MDLNDLADALPKLDEVSRPRRGPRESSSWKPKKVAVIGSGVAGLAAAKYLIAEQVQGTGEKYFDVTVFERHSKVAGIWNITSSTDDVFRTPMYTGLETNVPRTLMTFSDFPYKKNTSLFPTHDKIKEYLEEYADEIRERIRFNQEVVNVHRRMKNYERKWRVEIISRTEDIPRSFQEFYDRVIVATGTFNAFSMPKEVGLSEFGEANPGSVLHAGDFKDKKPRDFVGKKVFLIGGGPSYWDIAKRISGIVRGPLIVSTRQPLVQLSSTRQQNVAAVEKFLPEEKAVSLVDGTTINNIDIVLACTGYKYDFPFLPKLKINANGQRICELWEHLLWIEDITLAFVGLPKMGATMTIAEAQSAYIARVFSGRLSVPSNPGMHKEVNAQLEALGSDAKTEEQRVAAENRFHNLNYPKDMAYINALYGKSMAADNAGNFGKPPPKFDEYMVWTRQNLGVMRTAFGNQGRDKHRYTTPESLGFFYKPANK